MKGYKIFNSLMDLKSFIIVTHNLIKYLIKRQEHAL